MGDTRAGDRRGLFRSKKAIKNDFPKLVSSFKNALFTSNFAWEKASGAAGAPWGPTIWVDQSQRRTDVIPSPRFRICGDLRCVMRSMCLALMFSVYATFCLAQAA